MNNQSTKDKDARSSNAMAATSHPLATEEALKILKMGGNAAVSYTHLRAHETR